MNNDETLESTDQIIGGKSVQEWDNSWDYVPNGFNSLQSQLRSERGIFAAREGGRVMYIGAAVQISGGLRAGLARARLKDQTGNTSYGMKSVRAAGNSVEAYIIIMNSPIAREEIEELKWALIDRYKPPMNAPKDIVAAAKKAASVKRS
ncbi:hypothetical protein [Sphingomonas faeni]|uniref:hypothetical protein n=1 Tax=Sphingomonas faeni TaxID=185950 RepID=UPI00335F8A66